MTKRTDGDARAGRPRGASTVAALASPGFRVYWGSSLFSNVGRWMQLFALGYLVVQVAIRDGVPDLAPFYLGLFGLSQAIPGLAFGLFGGALADRIDRRPLLAVAQAAIGLVTGVLAILTLSDQITIGLVVGLNVLNATAMAVDGPARNALIPGLVPRHHVVSAVGLNSVSFNGAQLIGPMLGGFLYIPLGVGGILAFNALGYLIAAGAVLTIPSVGAPVQRRGGMLSSIREGLGYIAGEPVVRWVFVLTAGAAFLVRPFPQLMPAVAEQVLAVGAVELSWLMGAAGAGALVGAFVTASLAHLTRRGQLLLACAGTVGLLMAAFTLQRDLIGALPLLALVGFAVNLLMGMANTILQIRTPDAFRGRVLSVNSMVPNGVIPLGVMVLGSLGTVLGIDRAMLIGALALTALAAFAAVRGSALREVRIDNEHVPAMPESTPTVAVTR